MTVHHKIRFWYCIVLWKRFKMLTFILKKKKKNKNFVYKGETRCSSLGDAKINKKFIFVEFYP